MFQDVLLVGQKDLLFIYYCKNNHLAQAKWLYEIDPAVMQTYVYGKFVNEILPYCNLEMLKWLFKTFHFDITIYNRYDIMYKMVCTCNYHKLIYVFNELDDEDISYLSISAPIKYDVIKWLMHVRPNFMLENAVFEIRIVNTVLDYDDVDTFICILRCNPLILGEFYIPNYCTKIRFYLNRIEKTIK